MTKPPPPPYENHIALNTYWQGMEVNICLQASDLYENKRWYCKKENNLQVLGILLHTQLEVNFNSF